MNWFHITPRTATRASIVHLVGEIGVGRPVEEFIAELGDVPAVELRVDCPGGDTDTGLTVHDALQGRLVTATITGRCGSAVVAPIMAAHTISCISTARILIHPPTSFLLGNADQLRHSAFVLDELTTRTEKIISQRTKQDPATVRAWLSGENYFSAGEALKMRLIDHIYTPNQFSAHPLESASFEGSAGAPVKTDSEQMFEAWLAAFGKFKVHDRPAFLQKMSLWAMENITNE